MAKTLQQMTVAELEQQSYALVDARAKLKAQALAVQAELGKKVEAQRISKLLGREVQLVDVAAIESAEVVGDS